MTTELLLAMLAFGFAMSATPGPNTLLLLASGVNFGFRPTIPHMLGIMLGLGLMLLAVGLGLGVLLTSVPGLPTAMKLASMAYMVWLAWRIATSGRPGDEAGGARPMTWLEAALFQWVNPKAWAMALTGVAAYTRPEDYSATLAAFVAVLLGLSFPVTAAWTSIGVSLRGWLDRPGVLRWFNRAMAVTLLASLWPIIRDLTG